MGNYPPNNYPPVNGLDLGLLKHPGLRAYRIENYGSGAESFYSTFVLSN